MYHTPNLTGLRKRLVPKRVNEGWGLQHMKLYAIDDEIILSGANLSEDYFTNRQDRYHLFQSGEITEHFWRLFRGVSRLSYLLEPHGLGEKEVEAGGFRLTWPTTNVAPAPLEQPKQFVVGATKVLRDLVQPAQNTLTKEADTSVYIVTQLSQLLKPDTSTELPALTHVLKTLAGPNYTNSSWTFTAGYFNPAPSLTKLLISTASQHATVITASPQANGFYGSPGVSGLLPGGYTLLARRFLRSVHFSHRQDAITLKEWRRGTIGEPGGWTYHAKGLWVCMPGEANPSITLVGSSNYTKRSYGLDLEANALVVTGNEGLKRRLGEESRWLQEYGGVVTRDDLARNERRVGWDVRIAMAIVKLVGGAM
jgi:CDP-diacylglycerol---glycerol-3-phosphate 3-phosphatidyltransferase